jgi:hypothetical protein
MGSNCIHRRYKLLELHYFCAKIFCVVFKSNNNKQHFLTCFQLYSSYNQSQQILYKTTWCRYVTYCIFFLMADSGG